MSKPVVSVVGRPNVGKSTFFNKILGERKSIVEDVPGVTRDRIYGEGNWNGKSFVLIDTGGLELESKDLMLCEIKGQAEIAMDMSDVIIFLVDAKAGMTSEDMEIARMLMKKNKNVLLVANKMDSNMVNDNIYDFYELGFGQPIPISCANMLNFGDLLDEIVGKFPDTDVDEDDSIKVAIVGKPNVGKSSFVNNIIGENRSIVSDVAGTTRDAIDSKVVFNEDEYTLIDTAGIRRRNKVKENIEKYSIIRAVSAIERSDVCVLMIDASEGITEQDKKIVGIAHDEGKGIVIVVNKWDLVEKNNNTMSEFKRNIRSEFKFLAYAPIVFISVYENKRVEKVLETVRWVYENACMRVSTGKLNSVISDAIMMKQPPSDKGKSLKIYYVSQIGVQPPLFSFKINHRKLIVKTYFRYLENRIRQAFGFEGTSIKFIFSEKSK